MNDIESTVAKGCIALISRYPCDDSLYNYLCIKYGDFCAHLEYTAKVGQLMEMVRNVYYARGIILSLYLCCCMSTAFSRTDVSIKCPMAKIEAMIDHMYSFVRSSGMAETNVEISDMYSAHDVDNIAFDFRFLSLMYRQIQQIWGNINPEIVALAESIACMNPRKPSKTFFVFAADKQTSDNVQELTVHDTFSLIKTFTRLFRERL